MMIPCSCRHFRPRKFCQFFASFVDSNVTPEAISSVNSSSSSDSFSSLLLASGLLRRSPYIVLTSFAPDALGGFSPSISCPNTPNRSASPWDFVRLLLPLVVVIVVGVCFFNLSTNPLQSAACASYGLNTKMVLFAPHSRFVPPPRKLLGSHNCSHLHGKLGYNKSLVFFLAFLASPCTSSRAVTPRSSRTFAPFDAAVKAWHRRRKSPTG